MGGLQVWSNDIEAALNSHPHIAESAVGGVNDAESGECVIAWIVREGDQLIDPGELVSWCCASLAAYKVPTEIIFIEVIPNTEVGKILRRKLIAVYINQSDPPKS